MLSEKKRKVTKVLVEGSESDQSSLPYKVWDTGKNASVAHTPSLDLRPHTGAFLVMTVAPVLASMSQGAIIDCLARRAGYSVLRWTATQLA